MRNEEGGREGRRKQAGRLKGANAAVGGAVGEAGNGDPRSRELATNTPARSLVGKRGLVIHHPTLFLLLLLLPPLFSSLLSPLPFSDLEHLALPALGPSRGRRVGFGRQARGLWRESRDERPHRGPHYLLRDARLRVPGAVPESPLRREDGHLVAGRRRVRAGRGLAPLPRCVVSSSSPRPSTREFRHPSSTARFLDLDPPPHSSIAAQGGV